MSFFISYAAAQAASDAASGPGLEGLILPVGLIIMLYFLMIRPQMKRQKEHRKLVESLSKGDEVQTEGGMMGKITDLNDDFIKLEIADGKVTGNIKGDIIDGPKKADILKTIVAVENIHLQQTIAVGDGANDLPMISIAGLGVAFHAKPIVKENADQSISNVGLDGLLYLMGISEREIQQR